MALTPAGKNVMKVLLLAGVLTIAYFVLKPLVGKAKAKTEQSTQDSVSIPDTVAKQPDTLVVVPVKPVIKKVTVKPVTKPVAKPVEKKKEKKKGERENLDINF